VDDTWTMIGSSNLDRRSVVFNNEADAVIIGHDAAQQVRTVMQGYMDAAAEVDLKQWEHRSLRERLLELEARVWEYWM
jgi:cardiolipin synthase A/B